MVIFLLKTSDFRTFEGGSKVLNPSDKKRDKKIPKRVKGEGRSRFKDNFLKKTGASLTEPNVIN